MNNTRTLLQLKLFCLSIHYLNTNSFSLERQIRIQKLKLNDDWKTYPFLMSMNLQCLIEFDFLNLETEAHLNLTSLFSFIILSFMQFHCEHIFDGQLNLVQSKRNISRSYLSATLSYDMRQNCYLWGKIWLKFYWSVWHITTRLYKPKSMTSALLEAVI